MSGLPRELLKWMQSLDLSYSVKQVRRDFANGFLVAEILSRYYKADISMHSFDNGLGLVKRIENWALLEKLFRKLGFPIEHALIEQVIHCRSDAAIPLMEQLYTLLTHKTIQSSRAVKDREVVPPFARPTASQLIKERMLDADLAQQELLDEKVAPGQAKIVLATHMQRMKLEREIDPARFQPKATTTAASAASSASATLKPRKSASESFKEVQVRQMDDKGGVLAMRANQVYNRTMQPQGAAPTSPQHQHSLSQPSAAAFAPSSPSHAHSPSNGPSALSIFSGALIAILGAESPAGAHLLAASQQANKEPATVFADTEAANLPDAHAAFVLSQLTAQVSVALAETSLQNPKEFWQLSGVLFTLLARLAPDSAAFMTAVSLVSSIGVRLVSRDAAVSTALFMDFSYPKYLTLLQSQPRKVFQSAKIAYTFVADAPEEHGKLIREIHQSLMGNGADGSGTFFAVLAALAPFEGALLAANGFALLNSYMKLINDGLQPSRIPRVRATALSILAPLAANPAFDERVMRVILRKVRALIPHGPASDEQQDEDDDAEATEESAEVSAKLAKRIARPLADDAWLLDAELLHVLSCALSQPWLLSQPALVSQVHRWIEILLQRADDGSANIGAPFPTVRAGLAHLTHVLAAQPPLRKIWLGALLENDSLRSRILQLQSAESNAAAAATASSSSSSASSSAPSLPDDPAPELVDSFCPPLRSVWHPLTVCQSLSDQVRVQGLDNLSLSHLEIVAAATEDAFGGVGADSSSNDAARPSFPDSESAEWSAFFLSLRDHFVVELCEPSLSELVIGILRRFLFDARTSAAAQSLFLPNQAGAAAPPLYCIMRFMFPDAGESAQMGLAAFLDELATRPELVGLVHKNLQVFAENEPAKMEASPLGALLQKLDQQAAQAGR